MNLNVKLKFTKKLVGKFLSKTFAVKLILVLLFQIGFPTFSFALTGGPSQPEVQSFEPVGVSDMVDVFSGDFSYNIPLLDVEGYPINLSYHSGIGMDQEASWVGLGWNVNPGVINRAMRGIPDEFDGDIITKEQHVKKNKTVGISAAFAGELFGYDDANFTARLGIKYNNYTGVGVEKSFNVALSSSNKFGGSGTISLGITSSSEDGLSLSPSISLSQSTNKSNRSDQLGVSIGASYSSRGGLTGLTISPDIRQGIGSKNGSTSFRADGLSGLASAKFNFGQQTYTPKLDFPMENLSVTGNFKFGLEAQGFAGSVSPGGYYMEQGQSRDVLKNPAYGYMNLHNGQNGRNAMMDFNRENDGSFNKSTFCLPMTNLTYDIYSVSGQGVGGSYRPVRSDFGHVFDNASHSTSDGYTGSVEFGAGAISKLGTDFMTNSAYSQSGDWNDAEIASEMSYNGTGKTKTYEAWNFREANEKSICTDAKLIESKGGFKAAKVVLDDGVDFDVKATGKIKNTDGAEFDVKSDNVREVRDVRSQSISSLTNWEVYQGLGLFGGTAGSGIKNPYVQSQIGKLKHHIGQITTIATDGKRYVYAVPAYNKEQHETTFAIGKPVGGGAAGSVSNGEVSYKPNKDNSIENNMGLDNYFSNTIIPAHAHSYLLSAVLSPDYVDLTLDGPTDDDLGTYVLFEYSELSPNYHWRTPTKENLAKYNRGLQTDENDDKGSYVYGVKQLFYLNKITTKNNIAEFITSPRSDGHGVKGKNGGPSNTSFTYELDKIILKSKASGAIIKTVHFTYTYELCQQVENNLNTNSNGKLTLKRLHFTYQNSDKAAFSPYEFNYGTGSENPNYSSLKYDRWGNYKSANPTIGSGAGSFEMPFDFFPYTNQYNSVNTVADNDAAVWNLKEITLPSRGKIIVNYESDDYAYVQNQKACQMYLFQPSNGTTPTASPFTINNTFKFQCKIPDDAPADLKIEDLLPENKMAYFRFKMFLHPTDVSKFEYVNGYAEIDVSNLGTPSALTKIIPGSPRYAEIAFVPHYLNDGAVLNNPQVSPFVLAAIQFGRLNAPRVMWDQPNASAELSTQVAKALANSSFLQNIEQAAKGPNKVMYTAGKGTKADLRQCWLKLKNVNGKKLGGGCRVKSLILNDQFSLMSATESNSEYGQVYTYIKTDEKDNEISSGVATYEPQIGGEENALKEPFFTNTKRLLAPDDEHYVEGPFGECFFPSASIGYSAVKVENYYPSSFPNNATLTKHKTGYKIHEFYTAREFPTISERTELEAVEDKTDPFSLNSIFSIDTKDFMTTAQGFYVELNDMHGKPKAVRTFNNKGQEINSEEYIYKSEPLGNGTRHLTNKVKVIYANGRAGTAEVGIVFDMVGDLRNQSTETVTDGYNLNVDVVQAATPLVVTLPIFSYSSDRTQYRSATTTKVVQRFGILDKTIYKKDGALTQISNVAYDAESGEVLLTQTTNSFNDQVFELKLPAYWNYKTFGPAYKNEGYVTTLNFTNGKATLPQEENYFFAGDEIAIGVPPANSSQMINYQKAWVIRSGRGFIEIMDATGGAAFNGVFQTKIIRSGYKNMQQLNMGTLTTKVNPISALASNVFQGVIAANMLEYSDDWKANCDCINYATNTAGNPYSTGILGRWFQTSTSTYLGERTQSNIEGSTNIRKDGVFAMFSPYYYNSGGRWSINRFNWTTVATLIAVNSGGKEIESIDPLNRYSSATYDFNQSLMITNAQNAMYKEQGGDNFEHILSNCDNDRHFNMSITKPSYGQQVAGTDFTDSHTGRGCFRTEYNTSPPIFNTVRIKKPISTNCLAPKKCNGTIVMADGEFILKNAEYPIQINFTKVAGDGNIIINQAGTGFIINAANTLFEGYLVITDAKNCVYTKKIKHPFQ